MQGSKKRGIDIMLDMVFNHASTRHVWFQKALKGEDEIQRITSFSAKEKQMAVLRITGIQSLAVLHGNMSRSWMSTICICMMSHRLI